MRGTWIELIRTELDRLAGGFLSCAVQLVVAALSYYDMPMRALGCLAGQPLLQSKSERLRNVHFLHSRVSAHDDDKSNPA